MFSICILFITLTTKPYSFCHQNNPKIQEFHLTGSKILGSATDGLQFSKTFQAPHPYYTLWQT